MPLSSKQNHPGGRRHSNLSYVTGSRCIGLDFEIHTYEAKLAWQYWRVDIEIVFSVCLFCSQL